MSDSVVSILTALPDIEALRAELSAWRSAADRVDADTPDALDEWLSCAGLSIGLGDYGTWGQEALIALLATLGVVPGQGIRGVDGRINQLRGEVAQLRREVDDLSGARADAQELSARVQELEAEVEAQKALVQAARVDVSAANHALAAEQSKNRRRGW